MRTLLSSFALCVLALTAAACASHGSCEVVVDKTHQLVVAEYEGEKEQAEAREKLAATRADDIKKCQAQNLSKDAEQCAVAAKSLAELADCDSR